METTLTLDGDEGLLQEAVESTGLHETHELVREALRALIQREASRRAAQLGGTEPQVNPYRGGALPDLVLVDTSVWNDHLRRKEAEFVGLTAEAQVFTHPFVMGELLLGSLRNRSGIRQVMERLPQADERNDAAVFHFVEEWKLYGRGIGYVDAHLLASAYFIPGMRLWTRDRRLLVVAAEMGVAYFEER